MLQTSKQALIVFNNKLKNWGKIRHFYFGIDLAWSTISDDTMINFYIKVRYQCSGIRVFDEVNTLTSKLRNNMLTGSKHNQHDI